MQTIISRLRCNYLQNPIGIEDAAPRLFWQLQTARDGARQTACQIRVASSPDALSEPDFWDSGRVESAQTTHVIYEGTPLDSRQRAWWQVTVWDETGAEIQSEIAFWENGLQTSDWQAQWIAAPLSGGPNTSVPTPFLRRAFEVQKPIRQARLYASALGLYECEINGTKVGNHILAPGWTDYKKRVQYQTFDVTSHLQAGANVWGAMLGDGWYCGHVEWRGRQRYGDRPKFFGQLEIEYADGTRETIVSDEAWRCAFGPILQADLIMGESYDARQEFRGWSAPDFDASAWQAVQLHGADEFSHLKISAPLGPPVVAHEEILPVREPYSHPALPSTAWVFDMGQNMVGRVRLKVSGPRGATVRLRYSETLAAGPLASDGPIYTANLRSALQTDFYTLHGDGEEIWEPRFSFHGFRYVEVVGFPGTPTREAITGIVLHSDTPQTGDFECSDPLVTQLQRNIDWGQRGNFVDVPSDCPQRDERLGWTGDAQVFARTAAFNRDVAAFFHEWMRDVADAQTATGGVPCTVPDTGVLMINSGPHSGTSQDGGPAWSDALLIVPLTMYRCFGDTRILEENYETFVRYLDFQQSTARDHIRCYDGCDYFPGFGDWLALDGSGKTEGGTPRDLIGTAFFAHAADLMRQIAEILGKSDDAARYGTLFETVRVAFQKRFITPAGLMAPPYQTPYLLALQFNLMPDELRESATRELVKNIAERGDKLSTGFVGSPYINHVLTAQGRLDVAYQLLFQKEWPSWLYAVTQGATTIWERWDGWTHDKGFQDVGMNSFNHYAYGAIGAWLYQVVAGIELDDVVPGYTRFKLQPQPGPGLTWVKAHFDTLHGRIESDWKIENGTFSWRFVVPPNTSAMVTLPDGKTFEAGPGARKVQIEFKADEAQ